MAERALTDLFLVPEVEAHTPFSSRAPSVATLLSEHAHTNKVPHAPSSSRQTNLRAESSGSTSRVRPTPSMNSIGDHSEKSDRERGGHRLSAMNELRDTDLDLQEDELELEGDRLISSADPEGGGRHISSAEGEEGYLLDSADENSRPTTTTSPPNTARRLHSRKSTATRGSTASSTLSAIPDRPLHHEVQLLYKGRKYIWQAKVNLHVHVIRHDYADTIEVIAFNTSNFIEAEHVFVPASTIFQKVDEPSNHEKTEQLMQEYNKLHIHCPSYGFIYQGWLSYKAAMYLVDRLTVSLKPSFSIDIKESKQAVVPPTAQPNKSHNNKEQPTNENLTSITQRKPEIVTPCFVRRYGKSSTLVGELIGASLTKEEEILSKVILSLTSPSMANQAQRMITRASMAHKSKKHRHTTNVASNALKTFSKFRNDNDLLQESLSFLHISDFMILQRVCKRWHTVLGYALKATNTLWISSRDYYLNEEFVRRRLKSRYAMVSRRQPNRDLIEENEKKSPKSPRVGRNPSNNKRYAEDTYFYGNMSRYFRPRDIYVSSDTVIRAIRNANKTITELALHYVVMDVDLLLTLQSISGKLRRLTLGIIKVNDVFRKFTTVQEVALTNEPTVPEVDSNAIATVPSSPSNEITSTSQSAAGLTPATPRGRGRPSNTGKSILVQSRKMSTAVAMGKAPPTPTAPEQPKPSSPSTTARWYPGYQQQFQQYLEKQQVQPSALRFLQPSDVEQILRACGGELTHLEISLTVGELDQRHFLYAPKLNSLTIFNSHLAPRIQSVHNDLEGNVNFDDFVNAFTGIPMSDLLSYISDGAKEAFLLTDKRGRIVTANDAWERMFGYSRKDIVGRTVDFLGGYMTNMEIYEEIIEGLKTQIKSVESTVFLHQADGTPFLTQIILIPNCSKFRGQPLSDDCLTQDFIGQLALEQEEAASKGIPGLSSKDFKNQSKVKLDWRITNKEVSYHLLRFGLICEPFLPYERHVTTGPTGITHSNNNNNHVPITFR